MLRYSSRLDNSNRHRNHCKTGMLLRVAIRTISREVFCCDLTGSFLCTPLNKTHFVSVLPSKNWWLCVLLDGDMFKLQALFVRLDGLRSSGYGGKAMF